MFRSVKFGYRKGSIPFKQAIKQKLEYRPIEIPISIMYQSPDYDLQDLQKSPVINYSKQLRNLIQNMKYNAYMKGFTYMNTSNLNMQPNIFIQLRKYEAADDGDQQNFKGAHKDGIQISDYKVFVNPKIRRILLSEIKSQEPELSIPFLWTETDRFKEIEVEYQDENGKWVEEVLQGQEAVWYQHNVDITLGVWINDWRTNKGQLRSFQVSGFVLDAPNLKAFCEYQNSELLFLYQKYPKLFNSYDVCYDVYYDRWVDFDYSKYKMQRSISIEGNLQRKFKQAIIKDMVLYDTIIEQEQQVSNKN